MHQAQNSRIIQALNCAVMKTVCTYTNRSNGNRITEQNNNIKKNELERNENTLTREAYDCDKRT